jgi:hypothetical protein
MALTPTTARAASKAAWAVDCIAGAPSGTPTLVPNAEIRVAAIEFFQNNIYIYIYIYIYI